MIRNKCEQIKIINYLTSTTLYSKAEAKKLREDFWISFGKSFPHKWTLYDTKIKDFSFKFLFDTKKARVLLAIEDSNGCHYKLFLPMITSPKLFMILIWC